MISETWFVRIRIYLLSMVGARCSSSGRLEGTDGRQLVNLIIREADGTAESQTEGCLRLDFIKARKRHGSQTERTGKAPGAGGSQEHGVETNVDRAASTNRIVAVVRTESEMCRSTTNIGGDRLEREWSRVRHGR